MSRLRILIGMTTAALVAAVSATAAPPPNDLFAGAQVLVGASGSVAGSNVDATRELGEPAHGGDGGTSVWFVWTAPATSPTVFETCGSSFDTLLAVYTGSMGALSRVGANDDACGSHSRVVVQAVAGTPYSIAVDGYGGDTGSFTLRWRPLGQPPNDQFAAAQPLSGARGAIEDSTLGASTEPGEPSHGRASFASIWFTWTAPTAGNVLIETCGSTFDTVLAVYTGDELARLSKVAGGDDDCGLQSRGSFATRAGTTYRIALAGAGAGRAGTFRLAWVLAAAPRNVDAASSRRLRGAHGSLTSSNEGAAVDRSGMTTVWFRWRATATTAVAIDTCSYATFDTAITVYRETKRRPIAIDESDDSCELASRSIFVATKGAEYLIAVGGLDGAWGSFTLRWARAAPSSGRCFVPDVRGQLLGAARITLERSDCRLGRIVSGTSSIVPRGRVLAQYPLPGGALRLGSRVSVEVSR